MLTKGFCVVAIIGATFFTTTWAQTYKQEIDSLESPTEESVLAIATKFAKLGDSKAQLDLAGFYKDRNPDEARKWFSAAVKSGDPKALFALGQLQLEGDPNLGVAKNPQEAISTFRRSAISGDRYSQFQLAEFYRRGEYVQRDLKQAIYWYIQAEKSGDPTARLERIDAEVELQAESAKKK